MNSWLSHCEGYRVESPSKFELEPLPTWLDAPWVIASDCRSAFDREASLTLGAEEEVILVDPETLLPAQAIEHVLEAVDGDGRFAAELRACQLELITPVCGSPADVARELAEARREVLAETAGAVGIVSAGAHPLDLGPVAVTPRDRYREIAAECSWGARSGVPCGLHVHIALGGAERALAVYNALRSYLPEIAALAANSPFLGGCDSGLASSRLKLNHAMSRFGIPPAFPSWEDLADFLWWGARGGAFADASYLWWDLRPHLVHGTLEVRVADSQTRPEDTQALAGVCQTLVAQLSARYDEGAPLPVHDSARIGENLWLATRDGLRGNLINLDTGESQPTRARIAHLLAAIEPFARDLAPEGLALAWTLLSENGEERQRALAASEGIDGLLRWLAAETERPAFAPELAPSVA